MCSFKNTDDANSEEYCAIMLEIVDEVLETMRIEEEHLSMMKSSLSRHLLNRKLLPTSKALKLYTTLSLTSTANCFASMFKRKQDKCMMNCDDRSFEMLQRNANKLTLNVKHIKFIHLLQMTLHDMFKQ